MIRSLKNEFSWHGALRLLWFALRLYLGGLFVYASIHKIADPHEFAVAVATYRFLPLPFVNLFAITLPWVELVAGMMLIVGVRVRAAALLVSLMLVSFMIALAWALVHGYEMSCGCFASSQVEEDPISWLTMVRDGTWLLMSLALMIWDRSPVGIESLCSRLFEQEV